MSRDDVLEYCQTRDPEVRDRVVLSYEGLARRVASKYSRQPDDFDDVLQVSRVALVKALSRFDPARGVRFSTFAWATATGEVRRHLRETSWKVRVPRSLQECYLEVARARDDLVAERGRSPTAEEVAARVGRSVEEVIEATEAAHALRPASLNAPGGSGADDESLGELLGDDDDGLIAVEDRQLARRLLSQLNDHERHVLSLRFEHDLTQSAIAERLGTSQMQVSRMLTSILARLRNQLERERER